MIEIILKPCLGTPARFGKDKNGNTILEPIYEVAIRGETYEETLKKLVYHLNGDFIDTENNILEIKEENNDIQNSKTRY